VGEARPQTVERRRNNNNQPITSHGGLRRHGVERLPPTRARDGLPICSPRLRRARDAA
jgi:hypothetical protein